MRGAVVASSVRSTPSGCGSMRERSNRWRRKLQGAPLRTTFPCRSRASRNSLAGPMRRWRRPIRGSVLLFRPSGRWQPALQSAMPCRTGLYARFAAETANINRIVHDIVADLGGSISAEHGIGRLRFDENLRYKGAAGDRADGQRQAGARPAQYHEPRSGRACLRKEEPPWSPQRLFLADHHQ